MLVGIFQKVLVSLECLQNALIRHSPERPQFAGNSDEGVLLIFSVCLHEPPAHDRWATDLELSVIYRGPIRHLFGVDWLEHQSFNVGPCRPVKVGNELSNSSGVFNACSSFPQINLVDVLSQGYG